MTLSRHRLADSLGPAGFEFKWSPLEKVRPPAQWQKAYLDAQFEVVHPQNYLDFIL